LSKFAEKDLEAISDYTVDTWGPAQLYDMSAIFWIAATVSLQIHAWGEPATECGKATAALSKAGMFSFISRLTGEYSSAEFFTKVCCPAGTSWRIPRSLRDRVPSWVRRPAEDAVRVLAVEMRYS
jgi:hypothetical protein